MNRTEFFGGIEETYKECLEIVKKKNLDYAGEEDQFKNFRSAFVVGLDYKKAILVRILDKLSRISNCIDKEVAVKDEQIQDTIKDAINYLAILREAIKDDEHRTNI